MAKGVDWIAIKNEYINTNISYRKLAEKWKVSLGSIQRKSKKDNWQELRDTQRYKIDTKVIQKTQEKIIDHEVNRITKICNVADKLLNKLEQATDQLDRHLITNKTRVREIEYTHEKRPDKPTKETIVDKEEKIFVEGDIDKSGLKALTAALKDIKDISLLDADNNEKLETDPLSASLLKLGVELDANKQ